MSAHRNGAVVTRRFRVVGRVQGVYFRHSTRLEAERLGITGHARNLSDGSVEVVAVGSEAALQALREWLNRGPPSARVDEVHESDWDGETLPGEAFAVR